MSAFSTNSCILIDMIRTAFITVTRQTSTNGPASAGRAQKRGHTMISASTEYTTLSSGVDLVVIRYFLRFEKFVPNEAYPGVVESERGSNGPIEG